MNDDELPAVQAVLGSIEAIAFGPDGSLYVGGSRIRRVGPDGIIYPVTGPTTLPAVPVLEGRSAASVNVGAVTGLTVRNDGTVCFTRGTGGAGRVYAISPSGTIRRFAGTGVVDFNRYSGDGGPAVDAPVNAPFAMASSPDGSVYFGDLNYSTVRRVTPNGIITTVAGKPFGFDASGDGGPATAAGVSNGARRIAVGPDGSVYITDQLYMTTRRISPPDPLALTGEYRIPAADGQTVDVFSSDGRHLRVVDAITLVTLRQFGYSENRLSTITDKYGNVTRIERDAAGIATAIVSPFGKRTTLTMGGDGYLQFVDNRAGERIEMTYAAGQMKSMKNARGISKSMTYDGDGRLLREELADGGGTTLTRTGTDRNSRVAVQSGEGVVTVHERELDEASRDSRVDVDPATGLKVTTVRNGDGTSRVTMPDGTILTESVTADPRFKVLAPLRPVAVTTPSGRTLAIATERTVTLSNKTDPLSLRSITETFRVNGGAWQSTFTKATNVLSTVTPAGRTSTVTLNAKGDVASVQLPGLLPANIVYDPQGRVTSSQTGPRIFSVAYTAGGEVERVTDPMSRTTSFEYDNAGRLKRQTLPDTRAIEFTYDENGNLTSITPPGRPAHEFDHTVGDLVERYSPPAAAGGATEYAYDRDGKIIGITRPDGASIVPGYDHSARIATLVTPNGTYRYAYSPVSGNLTSSSEPGGGLLTYTYDGPLITSVAWSGPVSGTVSWTYDSHFRVSSENGTSYRYDADGLLTGAGALTLTRNAGNGLLTGTTLGAMTDAYSYNEFGEVTRYEAAVGTTSLFRVDYGRDASGRITSINESADPATAPGATYEYDRAGRLTRVSRDGAGVAEYDYDANSNRVEHRYNGGSASGVYDAQDRLLTYGDTTYTYTANGELASRTTAGETTTFDYDVLGTSARYRFLAGRSPTSSTLRIGGSQRRWTVSRCRAGFTAINCVS